jgi:hypothetical protein
MSLSNFAENLLLDWMFTAGTADRPAAWYVALHTGDPGETGANEVLVATDADYVRKSVTFGAASGGANASTSQVSWTVNSGSAGYTVTHASIWDASTSGNCLISGILASSRTLAALGVLTFEIGEVIAALD